MAYYRIARQAPAGEPERIGILVVNLGTPSSPSYLAVWRYLREFLGDRRVIDAPRVIWFPVLYGFILTLRSLRTVRNYRKVWMTNGSPLMVLSQALTRKLAARMDSMFGDRVKVELAMTYGQPSVDSVVAKMINMNVKRLLVLPLYPQYCSSTTGAVFDQVCLALKRWRWIPEMRFINDYYSNETYIGAIADSVREHWKQSGSASHLLLSFHGIPQVYVAQGDPYRAQSEGTTARVVENLKLGEGEFTLAYQSRFGPVLWLQPYTEDSLKALAARGVRQVTVVSPSFAVDCLETLEEIAVEYRETFAKMGGKLTMVPALNDSNAHVEVLAEIVRSHLQGWV
jgi:protoporphyrin/coproporphyrin ferrochelatase